MMYVNVGALVSQLIKTMFDPEEDRLHKQIVEFNTENKKLRGVLFDGFLFRGQFYRPMRGSVTLGPKNVGTPTLHYSLCPDMELWVRDRKLVDEDKSLIRQTLHQVLRKCHYDDQARNALPECLVSLVPELKGLPRLDDAAWTIVNDERSYRQYQKVLPKMEFYSTVRLFY